MNKGKVTGGGGGVLARLARDVRAAALAWMCIATIPFCGMVGGGIDIARMYITKTRLQHACDAGVLAGRKQMGSGVWGSDDQAAAERFFDANYRTGAYGTNTLTRTYAESAGKVTGSASATVPMTLMRVLGRKEESLSVNCDAEMRLPNTDVMFVLDTTGSMANKAVSTDSESKIDSLRTAVKCFYEIVARLDVTDANCVAGNPSGGTGNQVQIRFGFVPYSTNVNVGRLLKPEWMPDTWTYQSRVGRWWVLQKSKSSTKVNKISLDGVQQTQCNNDTATQYGYNKSSDSAPTSPYQAYETGTKRTTHREQLSNYSWNANNGKNTCYADQTITHKEFVLAEVLTEPTSDDEWYDWRYGAITQSIKGLKNGTGWNSGMAAWTGNNGTLASMNWDGCIHERPTVSQASYTPIPSTAYDLNVDSPPTDANTMWGPAINDLLYLRSVVPPPPGSQPDYSKLSDPAGSVLTQADYIHSYNYFCPAAATKLKAWGDADEFKDYVNSLTTSGNTYHDIGMLWGARLISPTGIFSSENAYTSQGGEIDRHLIFMTDGDAQAAPCDYAAYGLPWFDKKTTTDVGAAADCAKERAALDNQVNARLTALCTVVKNKNITLWVISFGSGSNTATETRLSNCATPGRYFTARDSASLQSTFASIANQISQLRLTQ